MLLTLQGNMIWIMTSVMPLKQLLFIQLSFITYVLAYEQLVTPGITEAISSSTFDNYFASRSVDGDFSQDLPRCSHTDANAAITEAWLRVDLRKTFSLKSVKFWYRRGGTDTRRLPGYSIRVSNTPILSSASICYQDPGASFLPNIIEKQCYKTGQYVWFYQDKKLHGVCPMLEICEVQIFGCQTGRYGDYCNKSCDHCQNRDKCDIVSGECDNSGCANRNFVPPMCKDCISGIYGPNCLQRCSEFCKNKACDRNTGSCFNGCERGYYGSHCNRPCPSGTYGYDCQQKCGQCYQMHVCNHKNGDCVGGCKEGFKGELCKTPCSDGEFGKDCIYNCSAKCLNNAVCDKYNGKCDSCSSGYEGPRCDKRKTGDQPHVAVIAGPISGITIVALVTFIVIMFRRRNSEHSRQMIEDNNYQLPEIKHDENAYEELNTDEETIAYRNTQSATQSSQARLPEGQIKHKNVHEPSGKQTLVPLEFDKQHTVSQSSTKQHNHVKCPAKSVMIQDLRSRIHNLEEQLNEGFLNEFESLSKKNPGLSCSTGKLRENVTKNRSAKALPYDDSRVILQSTVSDYVNASFIKNTNGDTSYIASQEPMTNTYSDFWQMVWQEDVHVIAMVSIIEDDTREKPKQYWPDMINATISQGTFALQLKSEKTYSHFTIRTFMLTNKKSRQNRQTNHLQFTAWPEGRTPHPLDLLVYYRHMTRAMEKHPKNKLLVHCSSGIGPTAVIIALDALYKHGLKTGMVNIMDFVNKIREDRMNMIESLEQYICLYHVLYEFFRANFGILNKDQFLTNTTLQNVTDEFNILSAIKPNDVSLPRDPNVDRCTEYQNTMMHESVFGGISAEKTNSVQSLEEGNVLPCSAVILSSFTTRNCIIAWRYPGQGEAVDLIRLLIDHKCSVLVSVNPLADVPYSKEWFSASSEIHNIQIEMTPVAKISEHITLSTLRARESFAHHWHQTTVYELTSWTYSDNIPCDFNPILDVIKSVQLDNLVDINKKLIVLSRDGVIGCGLFCAVYNAIQQLQQDDEVDMFTIVRQLQSRRPEMISDLNEYLCCCNVLKQYIKRK